MRYTSSRVHKNKFVFSVTWLVHTHKKKSRMFKENLSLSKMEHTKLQEPAEFRAVGDFQNCCFDLSVGYSLVLNHTRLKLRNVE